jgi:hypothetical protein
VTVNPVPTITVSLTGQPDVVLSPAQPSAVMGSGQVWSVDEFTVPWGRRKFSDHQDPATAQFTVLQTANHDATGSMLPVSGGWQGARVTMAWSVTVAGVTTTRTFFRGRVTDLDVRPRRTKPGAYIDVAASSKVATLGNVLTPTESWPDESGDARMNRLRALVAPYVGGGAAYRTVWAGAPMAARNVDATSVLDLLRSMYDTAGGDRMVYDPHTDAIGYVRRRSVQADAAGANYTSRLRTSTAAWSDGLVFISPHVGGSGGPGGGQVLWPMLDSAYIEAGGDGTLSRQQPPTRVTYRWTEAGAAKSNYIYEPVGEAVRGVVNVDLSTELRDGAWAATAGSDWFGILNSEGSTFYADDPATYRADRAGGFDTLAAAQLLLSGTELDDGSGAQGSANMVFLAGSLWQRLGMFAGFGVIGGEIHYSARNGGWRPKFHIARGNWEGAVAPNIKLRELLTDATKTPFTVRQFARPITWNDLRTVQSW